MTRLAAEPVVVRYPQGLLHGFLILRTLAGERLADGELIQIARGDRVMSHLVFHFLDGSLQDETTVFTQHGRFKVASDHLVQRGPAFPRPLDLFVNATTGRVVVRYADTDGRTKTTTKQMDLPDDLANGILPVLLENVRPEHLQKQFSLVVATPDPRLVTLQISKRSDDVFITGVTKRRATHYVLKVDLGGLAGLLAPLAGKQPPDSQVWVLAGDGPTFLKAEEPFYPGAPLWRIELVSPE